MNRLEPLKQKVLKTPWVFYLILMINLLGALLGYFWYHNQLISTDIYFWPFVPDCPTAALLVFAWLLFYKLNIPSNLLKLLAVTAAVKYGIWTIVVIILIWIRHGFQYWEYMMLFISHIGLLIEGLVFSAGIKINRRNLYIVAAWLLLNDFMDYSFSIYPWIPIPEFLPWIRIGTITLSYIIILWLYRKYSKEEINWEEKDDLQ